MVGIKNIQRHTPSDEYFTPEYVWRAWFKQLDVRYNRRKDDIFLWEPFDIQRKGYFAKVAEEEGWKFSTLGWDNRDEIFKLAAEPQDIVLVTNPPYSGSFKTDIMEYCKENKLDYWLLLPSIIPFHNYGMHLLLDHEVEVNIFALPQVDYEYKGEKVLKADGSEKDFKKSPFRSILMEVRHTGWNTKFNGNATLRVLIDCVKNEKAKEEILNPRYKRRKLRENKEDSNSPNRERECTSEE